MKIQIRKCNLLLLCFMAAVILLPFKVHASDPYMGATLGMFYSFEPETGELLIGDGSRTEPMPDFDDDENVPKYLSASWSDDIKTITIRQGLTTIGDYAFYNCRASKIQFEKPSLITKIGKYAFCECEDLTAFTIPSNVTSIGTSAFEYSGIKSIKIPKKAASIGKYVFTHCRYLTSITVDSKNKNLSSKNGVLFSKKKGILIQYPAGKKGTSYTMPDSVTTIRSYAFSGDEGTATYSDLKTLKISKKIKKIESKAFIYTILNKIYFKGNRPTISGGTLFDEDMAVTIYYKKAKWAKKYRKKYGAFKTTWKKY